VSPRSLAPAWLPGYRREWLLPDVIAGLVIWSVVVPQAVAYAQIAGLPPQAGLMAAPGALIAYALLGTSRTLVVGATTSTAAVSAAAVGPLAAGDTGRFAALSAAFALVTAVVFLLAGLLRFGAIADFISKPVMTGFLFGLGLTIAIGQLPALFGVAKGDGRFFSQLWDFLGDLDATDGATLAVGLISVAALVLAPRLAPRVPGTLLVLVLAIALSALLDLKGHGVAVVGDIPDALPDISLPDASAGQIVDLIAPAFGILVLSAEGIGVARTLAARDGAPYDVNRDLVAFGGSNALAGFSMGFVQCGGASQTAAADRAGGKTQLASLVSAGLVLLTGAFLAPLFEDLPQATLAAIVIVAVARFADIAALRRYATIRRSAIALALVALVGVLVLGILQGLVVAAVASLILVIQRLSRPTVGPLGRDPATGVWGRADLHPGWERDPAVLVMRSETLLLYPNALYVKDRVDKAVAAADPRPRVVVLDLSQNADLDVETADMLGELAGALATQRIALRLAYVRTDAAAVLHRAGVDRRARLDPTIDAARDDG
jgi:high affinity sulfate transporter 1